MEHDLSPKTENNKLKEFIKTNILELQQSYHKKYSSLSLENSKGNLRHLTEADAERRSWKRTVSSRVPFRQTAPSKSHYNEERKLEYSYEPSCKNRQIPPPP